MKKLKMIVDEDVLAAMGLSEDEFRGMGLMDFFRRAMDKGYDVNVSSAPARNDKGRLTVTMGKDAARV